MLLPKWAKDYLTFNRKDRIGAVLFVVVVAGCVWLPGLFAKPQKPVLVQNRSPLLLAVDTLQKRQSTKRQSYGAGEDYSAYRYEPTTGKGFKEGELFRFDPNTASLADWQRLGLNDRTSKTILKYVSKGGKFYKPEDLQRIWSLPAGFYERVKEYMIITATRREYPAFENKPFVREERKPVVVNINEADTAGFIALPGIGSRLSARIINFREKLGGFYSVEQVGETYGVPDSTFQAIKARLQVSGDVRKININTATKDELKVHPYIRWNLANAIVEYRSQHGAFKTLEELKNIVLIDEGTYTKMRPYLSL